MKKFTLPLFIIALIACNTDKPTSVAPEPAAAEKISNIAVIDSDADSLVDSKYMITSGAVDIFRIGEIIPTEVDGYIISKTVRIYREEGEEYEYNVYTVSENGEEVLQIENRLFGDSKPMIIDDIDILSDKLKTSKNIGLGSTIEEFVVAYPDYELGTTVEDDMASIRTGQLDGVGFFIDNDDILTWPEDSGYVIPLKPSNFKKGAKIIEIHI